MIPQVIKKIVQRQKKNDHLERLHLLQFRHNKRATERDGVEALDDYREPLKKIASRLSPDTRVRLCPRSDMKIRPLLFMGPRA